MNSMISIIAERVAGLESTLRALQAEQTGLRAENQRLREQVEALRRENDVLRGQTEELRQQCDVLGRESAESRAAEAGLRASLEAWRDAYHRLEASVRSALDHAEPPDDEHVPPAGGAVAAGEPAARHLGQASMVTEQHQSAGAGSGPARDAETAATLHHETGGEGKHHPVVAVSDLGSIRTYDVVAFPFERFADLRAFQESIRSLPGTRDVRLRHFDKGTLELRVEYDGPRPFDEALAEIQGFSGTVSRAPSGELHFQVSQRGSGG